MPKANQKEKTEKEIREILRDMAKIRQVILENAPQCLPILAPAFIDAEQRIKSILIG